MVELVDTLDSKSSPILGVGSSPTFGTIIRRISVVVSTSDFHSGVSGSNPESATIFRRITFPSWSLLFFRVNKIYKRITLDHQSIGSEETNDFEGLVQVVL